MYFNLKSLPVTLFLLSMKPLIQIFCLFTLLAASTPAKTLDTSTLEQIIWCQGTLNTNEGVSIIHPYDLKFRLDGWNDAAVSWALASWAAFTNKRRAT